MRRRYRYSSIIHDNEKFMGPLEVKTVRTGDHLIIKTDEETLLNLFKNREIRISPESDVTQKQLENPEKKEIVDLVFPDNSFDVSVSPWRPTWSLG